MSQSASVLDHLYQEELYAVPSRVLVILSSPWEALSENEQTVLSKMLAAVKLSLASVQIITKKEFTIGELSAFSPTKVLAFGAMLQPASKLYENTTVDGIPVILADPLSGLDDLKKKNLWGALKQMFGL
jgi:hypothetical protein